MVMKLKSTVSLWILLVIIFYTTWLSFTNNQAIIINNEILPKIRWAIKRLNQDDNSQKLKEILIYTKNYYLDSIDNLATENKVIWIWKNWTGSVNNKEIVYESEELSQWPAWKIIDDDLASGRSAIQAIVWVSRPGTIQFWPYESDQLFAWKKYIAVFRIKIGDNKILKPIGLIDVFDENAKYRSYKEITWTDFLAPNTFQEIEIPFTKTWEMTQYRVFFYGLTDITVDKVSIREKKRIRRIKSGRREGNCR
jgi:hypothetical protein